MKAYIPFSWIFKVAKAFNLLLVVIEGGVGNFFREAIQIIPLKVGALFKGVTNGGRLLFKEIWLKGSETASKSVIYYTVGGI